MPGASRIIACAAQALPASVNWLALVGGLHTRPGFWWLDSSAPCARQGRFSFAGCEPWGETRIFGGRAFSRLHRPGPLPPPPQQQDAADPLAALRALLPAGPVLGPAIPFPFAGGVIAALGYELADGFERLPPPPEGDLPDATLLGIDRLYAWDHLRGLGYAAALASAETPEAAQRAAQQAARELAACAPQGEAPCAAPSFEPAVCDEQAARAQHEAPAARQQAARAQHEAPAARQQAARADFMAQLRTHFDAAGYGRAVQRIRRGIFKGDLYQACLTHRIEFPFCASPFALYGALRETSPAPFSAYLALPDFTWLGASPERFLAATRDGLLESRPIKGTRPRRSDAGADRAEREALLRSAKDRAENLMIVDLVRNDLGRVAECGSVQAPELFVVEPHAGVFQLVSTVQARLAQGADVIDAVRAAFPPGSMTGAPKLAAMTLLRALEPVRRGPYAGALGYFDVRGGADLSVVIRTIFVREGRAWLHTGGGVVYDSDPQGEWQEAEDKVRVLLETAAAVSAAGGQDNRK